MWNLVLHAECEARWACFRTSENNRPGIKEDSQDSSVSRVSRPWSGRESDELRFNTYQVQEIFVCTVLRLVLLPIQSSTWWILGRLFPKVKQRVLLMTHSQLVQRFRMCGAVPPLVHTTSWHGVYSALHCWPWHFVWTFSSSCVAAVHSNFPPVISFKDIVMFLLPVWRWQSEHYVGV
jgi:hypothetical protein